MSNMRKEECESKGDWEDHCEKNKSNESKRGIVEVTELLLMSSSRKSMRGFIREMIGVRRCTDANGSDTKQVTTRVMR